MGGGGGGEGWWQKSAEGGQKCANYRSLLLWLRINTTAARSGLLGRAYSIAHIAEEASLGQCRIVRAGTAGERFGIGTSQKPHSLGVPECDTSCRCLCVCVCALQDLH